MSKYKTCSCFDLWINQHSCCSLHLEGWTGFNQSPLVLTKKMKPWQDLYFMWIESESIFENPEGSSKLTWSHYFCITFSFFSKWFIYQEKEFTKIVYFTSFFVEEFPLIHCPISGYIIKYTHQFYYLYINFIRHTLHICFNF